MESSYRTPVNTIIWHLAEGQHLKLSMVRKIENLFINEFYFLEKEEYFVVVCSRGEFMGFSQICDTRHGWFV